MSFAHFLVIISAVVSVSGSLVYLKNTIKGTTKPNRVSWGMWALAPMVATGAALSAHADVWATTRTFLSGFMPLLIFIFSFLNIKSYWKLTIFDAMCGLCSVVAFILWVFINSTDFAILFALVGDGFACLPTIIKAWKYPETETGLTFVAGFVATLLVLPSIPVWNIQNAGFQIYLLVANVFLFSPIYYNRIFGKREYR